MVCVSGAHSVLTAYPLGSGAAALWLHSRRTEHALRLRSQKKCLLRSARKLFLRDQPDLIVIKYIIPRPVEHHNNSIAEADDAVDVQEDPDHPGDISTEGDAPNACDGGIASNGGKQAGVSVMKMSEWFFTH